MKSKIISVFSLTTTLVLGALTSSQADGNLPFAEISISNYQPNVGDPIAIYLDLYNCANLPTSISVTLSTGGFINVPFVTLSKSSTGYKAKKVGNVFKVEWLYRGPTGDGISGDYVTVSADAAGGCVTDSAAFRDASDSSSWSPYAISTYGHFVFAAYAIPDLNGLKLWWISDSSYATDESRYFEIQYAISGTSNWSRSFVTQDSNYNLRGLTKGIIYEVRIRAGDKNGIGDWQFVIGNNAYQTPASFISTSQKTDTDVTPTRTFATGDTVKMGIRLDDCAVDPSVADGPVYYYLFAVDRSQGQFPPRLGPAGSEGFSYDGSLKRYTGSVEFSNLPDGEYQFYAITSRDCGWTYGPESLSGPIISNLVEFSVGPTVAQIPRWGSGFVEGIPYSNYRGVVVTALSSTSATLSWGRPENLKDGPFAYTVELLKSDGSVSKVLGTTKNHSFNVSGLKPLTNYQFRVLASNSVTTNSSMRPYALTDTRTPNLTVKRGSKLSAATYAKAIGVVVPAGATLTIAKPAGTFIFADCTFAKNIVTFKNSVGACTVQLTIKPKKVGKKQPKSITSQHDVMIKR